MKRPKDYSSAWNDWRATRKLSASWSDQSR